MDYLQPTKRLRFTRRMGQRVLQQWWGGAVNHPVNPGQGAVEVGEWRDVPLSESNFVRMTAGGLEFLCPYCHRDFSIGWKTATFWACPHCKESVDVKTSEADDDATDGDES